MRQSIVEKETEKGERRAHISVKNASSTLHAYTLPTIDRQQRGRRVTIVAPVLLAEAGHRAVLSAIETRASWRENNQLTVVFGLGRKRKR